MDYSIKNQSIEVKLLPHGALEISDHRTATQWRNRVPGYVVFRNPDGEREVIDLRRARSTSSEEGNGRLVLTYIFAGPPTFELGISFALTDDSVEMTLEHLITDSVLEEIVYPAALGEVQSGIDDGYVVVPHHQGVIIPSRLESGFMRCKHNTWAAISDVDRRIPFNSVSLNMPWYGLSRDESSLYFEVQTPADCSLWILGNIPYDEEKMASVDTRDGRVFGRRISALTPIWRASRGALSYPRRLTISTLSGGYVGMCQRYRKNAERKGLVVTLKEKIRQNPGIERMIGAVDVKTYIYTHRLNEPALRSFSEPILDGYEKCHTTFGQVGQMMSELRARGVDRAMFLLGGWNRAGYDREHVDMWPPAEPAGGVDGLSRLSEQASSTGYVLTLHDNYQDFYPDAPTYDPRYIMKDRHGAVLAGGIWDGGLCHLICSKPAIDLLKRTLKEVLGTTKVSGYYLDTITSATLYECFDSEHPLTRNEDRNAKEDILDFIAQQSLVVGGEGGVDWAVPKCVFFEGTPGRAKGHTTGIEGSDFGISTPLFNLVYHDCIIQYWQHGQPFGRFDHSSHVLHNVLTAQPPNFSLIFEQWKSLLPHVVETAKLLGALHRRTVDSRMIAHSFLNADYSLQQAAYEDGTRTIVNFGMEEFSVDAVTMSPRSFLIVYPDGTQIHGSFDVGLTSYGVEGVAGQKNATV